MNSLNLNLLILVYFFKIKFLLKNFENNKDYNIDLYCIFVCKSLHFKVNYYDLIKKIFQFYSIGLILILLKIIVSKSLRRNIKGFKILINFFAKKLLKFYKKKNVFLKVKGLSKFYLKFFYYLINLVNDFEIKYFVWLPLKSWEKNNIKIIKSIKRRIKKKLIKLEYKN